MNVTNKTKVLAEFSNDRYLLSLIYICILSHLLGSTSTGNFVLVYGTKILQYPGRARNKDQKVLRHVHVITR